MPENPEPILSCAHDHVRDFKYLGITFFRQWDSQYYFDCPILEDVSYRGYSAG